MALQQELEQEGEILALNRKPEWGAGLSSPFLTFPGAVTWFLPQGLCACSYMFLGLVSV